MHKCRLTCGDRYPKREDGSAAWAPSPLTAWLPDSLSEPGTVVRLSMDGVTPLYTVESSELDTSIRDHWPPFLIEKYKQ